MKKLMWNWRCWMIGPAWNEWALCIQIGPLSILRPTKKLKEMEQNVKAQQAAKKGLTTQTSMRRSKTLPVREDAPRGE